MNRSKGSPSLIGIYEAAGISKQAHVQYMNRRCGDETISRLVVNLILEVRSIHSVMGLKKIYQLLQPDGVGRDRFVDIGMENGLGAKIIKSFRRTTFSTKSKWFINLTAGLEINDINQVWVSDITYFQIGDRFCYLTFIVDVYSRRIIGYEASNDLRAESNCLALKSALRARFGHDLRGVIHHSDRGSQYASNNYLKMLSDNAIAVSMCDTVYENTHMERVNGIIKNEYLIHYKIKSLEELKKGLKRAVRLYNEERPHWSLYCKSPASYEADLVKVEIQDRDILSIYSEPGKYYMTQLFDS